MIALRIARVSGIDVRIDLSALVVVGLVAWIVSAGVLPELAPGYATGVYWTVGVAAAALFFVSLLAHEVAHAVAARRRGIVVRDITLWLLGGLAQIEGEPKRPEDEFSIAAAGPLTSAVIGVLALTAAAIAAVLGAGVLGAAFAWLGLMNLLLAAFNLIPASPLDGGRLLRAWLWKRSGDRTQAAMSAARSGEVFGRAFIALGVLQVLFGSIAGLWTVLIGWFVLSAARQEESQLTIASHLAGVRVGDVMTEHPITVGANVSIPEFLDDFVLRLHCSTFPVVDDTGAVVGLATLARARTRSVTRRTEGCVLDIAWPLDEVTTAAPDEPLAEVLPRLLGGDRRILVFDQGVLVGIVSPTDVARTLEVATARDASDTRRAA